MHVSLLGMFVKSDKRNLALAPTLEFSEEISFDTLYQGAQCSNTYRNLTQSKDTSLRNS